MTPEQRAFLEQIQQQQAAQSPQALVAEGAKVNEAQRKFLEDIARQQYIQSYGASPEGGGTATMSAAPEPVTPFEEISQGLIRGGKNITQGAKQLYLQLTDPDEAERYRQRVNAEIQAYNRRYNPPEYQNGRLVGEQEQFDIPQIIGEAAPYALGGAAIGGARAGTGIVSNLLRGAAGGAIPGALTYVPSGEMSERAVNTIVGGAGGGLTAGIGAPAARGAVALGQGGQILGRRATQAMQGQSPQGQYQAMKQAMGETVTELQDNLSPRAATLLDADKYKASLNEQLNRQLRELGEIDPVQAERAANIERITGMQGTRAQITRDAGEWTREKNLSKELLNSEEGSALASRYEAQDQAAQEYVRNLAAKIGQVERPDMPRSNFAAGSQAVDVIKRIDEADRLEVDKLYDAFRQADIDTKVVPTQNLQKRIDEVLLDFDPDEDFPKVVTKRLKEFGFIPGEEQPQKLTIRDADKLSKLLYRRGKEGEASQREALRQIREEVDRTVFRLPDDVYEGLPRLREARNRASERFTARESSQAILKALDDMEPDDFLKKFVLKGKVRDIEALKNYMRRTDEGAQAWNKLKGRALQSIIDDVTKFGDDEIKPRTFMNRLNQIEIDQLEAIYEPEEIQAIQNAVKGVFDMFAAPRFANENFSGTTAALLGRLSSGVQFTPILGESIQRGTQALQEQAKRSAASAALRGEGVSEKALQEQRERILQRLLRRQTPIAGATGGVAAIDSTRDRQQTQRRGQ